MKILVGCPTSDYKSYCLNEYAAGVKAIQGTFDVLVVDNSATDAYAKEIANVGLPVVRGPFKEKARDRIVACRNVLRQKVLDEGYDWFFSLEQDVIPPADVLERLLAAKKKIISGVYTKDYNLVKDGKKVGHVVKPLLWMIHNGKQTQLEMEDLKPARVQQVFATGLGCMLIHRSVLETIPFRWDEKFKGFDDVFFCADAQQAGFGVFTDTSILCEHLEMSWEGIEK